MKTIGDLERWLKGAGNGWQIAVHIKRDEFMVSIDKAGDWGVGGKSRYLEGALENAMEELRRKENGAESVRTVKAEDDGWIKTLAAKLNSTSGNPPAINVHCPKCNHLIRGTSTASANTVICGDMNNCGYRWQMSLIPGAHYVLQPLGGNIETWRYDGGFKWTLLP